MDNIFTTGEVSDIDGSDDELPDFEAMLTALRKAGLISLDWKKVDSMRVICNHPTDENLFYLVIAFKENDKYFFYPRLCERVYNKPELDYALGYDSFSMAINWCESNPVKKGQAHYD